MSELMEKRQRRLIIEKDFQYRFTLTICLAGGLIFLIFGGTVLFLLKLNYELFIQEALIQMPEMVASLKREFRLLSLGLVTGFIILISVLFGLGLVLTQRVAGPLFSLKRRLKEFAEGKQGVRLRLRSGDEFHNLEEVFNLAMEMHERRRHREIEELRVVAHRLREEGQADVSRQLEELLQGRS